MALAPFESSSPGLNSVTLIVIKGEGYAKRRALIDAGQGQSRRAQQGLRGAEEETSRDLQEHSRSC